MSCYINGFVVLAEKTVLVQWLESQICSADEDLHTELSAVVSVRFVVPSLVTGSITLLGRERPIESETMITMEKVKKIKKN